MFLKKIFLHFNKRFIWNSFSIIFFHTFFSFSLGSLANTLPSNQIFDKAVSLLKENYYNQRFINKVLSADSIDLCKQRLSKNQNSAIQCLIKLIRDPYTKYLSVSAAQREFKRIQTIRASVGIIIDPLNAKNIIRVLVSSPAEKAGIKRGDKILTINGLPVDLMNENEIAQKIREINVGDKLNLDLQRGYLYYSASLKAQEIYGVALRSKIIDNQFLYLKIDDLLASSASDEVLAILRSPESVKSKGLILDLRSNKGGLLNCGINISDFFLKSGNILISENKDGDKHYKADSKIEYTKPLVVLVNNETASASEVIAAALQENHRAIIIGSTTFGKGLIQQIKTLPDGSALHITISKFFTPTGKAINGIGVQPDIYTLDSSEQITAAIAYLKTYLQTAGKN